MFRGIKSLAQNLVQDVSDNIDRRGIGAIALIVSIEIGWGASILLPILFVLYTLIDLSKNWMAILPGFWGIATFLLALALGVVVAYQPSIYVARWRGRLIEKFAEEA
jgi:hypothetical protein